MTGERSLPALLQQENADLRGRVADLEAELRYTEGDLAVSASAAIEARREVRQLFRRLSDQEKYNIASRRSLCEQSDRYRAERDALAETLQAARDYVDHQWGRAEQAAEQVKRIDSAGVALAFADLAAILGSDGDEQR